MENKFKVGDKVKIAKTSQFYNLNLIYNPTNPPETEGFITEIDENLNEEGFLYITVKWNNNIENSYADEDLELVETDKLDLAVKKLKEDLLNQDITIKTTNEQRIMLRAICQELDIPHYGISKGDLEGDIDATFNTLYTVHDFKYNNKFYLWYTTGFPTNRVLINFEDLIAEFNQFKK